jgi:nucleotide-binding universal stress UspA family protein
VGKRPSVLCAVDFSPASRGALRYAAALAEHFYATLSVVTVNDQFLSEAASTLGDTWLELETEQALEHFVRDSFRSRRPQLAELRLFVKVGKPATEILRVANDTDADAIVMSTHGARGVKKLIFGSTTQRVLRRADRPVIVTPAADPGPETLERWTTSVKCVMAPIDLSGYSARQLAFARGLAEALGTAIVVTHVVEPPPLLAEAPHISASAEATRHVDAYRRVEELVAAFPSPMNSVIAIGSGNPADEIARLARELTAGAIVMALHTSPDSGRPIGTVTYRLLCQTPTVVIACPPSLLAGDGFGLIRSFQARRRPEQTAAPR